MPRKAPRKPPIGNDWMPLPDNPRPLPRKAAPKPKSDLRGYAKPATRHAKLKPMAAMPPGTKKRAGTRKVAKRTAPRPTRSYR